MNAVGQIAPDFTLEGTDGSFTLSQQRGKIVVLLFYPGDNTTVCTRQFCSYRDDGIDFKQDDAIAVGISSQNIESHVAFQQKHQLTIPLLVDSKHQVAQAYGVWRPIIGTRRATIIIDQSGTIRFRHVHRLGIDYVKSATILQEILKLR